uniref:Uncharacterized protein n=1 Tax=Electrophorus electricus TaxID=8005 RepID=A0A4W4EUZ7_ELEEL
LQDLNELNRAYQRGLVDLVESGRYDSHSNFTVVLQPFLRDITLPLMVREDGNLDLSYFTVDCLHLSERAHSEMAIALWNNMLEPVGKKQAFNNFTYVRTKIHLPNFMVLAVTGLLLGWGITWLFLWRRFRKMKIEEKPREEKAEMKGTNF